MKSSQQERHHGRLQVLEQEMILQERAHRSGMDNMAVVGARIVPPDHIDPPAQEAVRPSRTCWRSPGQPPRRGAERHWLEMPRITTLGVKDAMLPQLNGFATFSNSGLAGQVKHVAVFGDAAKRQTGNVYAHRRGRESIIPGGLWHGAGPGVRAQFSEL